MIEFHFTYMVGQREVEIVRCSTSIFIMVLDACTYGNIDFLIGFV